MGENKRFHLDLIQNVISRFSQNSYIIKGWSVTLVSAMFALAAQKENLAFIYLPYFPTFIFWILDSYFLWQEKLYRALFNHVRLAKEEDIDFSLNASIFQDSAPTWGYAFISRTMLLFHGAIVLSILIVMIFILSISN